jgi:hypothetical protein
VVELVDAPDSKSGSERSVGSIPTARTTFSTAVAELGLKGSNSSARFRIRFPQTFSVPIQTAGKVRFRGSGLVARGRNDTAVCSLNARSSPTAWERPIESTGFSLNKRSKLRARTPEVAVSCARAI